MKKLIIGTMLALPLMVTSVATKASASTAIQPEHAQALQTSPSELIAYGYRTRRVYHRGYYSYEHGRRHYHRPYYSTIRIRL
ncbi:MAG: hypothetical protein PUP91_35740 [Rhizonema sp. PD37]|nr:hypothetical protein [Rhizonema sp. PD37]